MDYILNNSKAGIPVDQIDSCELAKGKSGNSIQITSLICKIYCVHTAGFCGTSIH